MAFIEIRKLTKSFGNHSIIQNLNLTIEKGQKIAIKGES